VVTAALVLVVGFALLAAVADLSALADGAAPLLSPQPIKRAPATTGVHSDTSAVFKLFIRFLP